MIDDEPIRFFSLPLNQEISADGFAWTWHLITTGSPNAAYWIKSPWKVIGTKSRWMSIELILFFFINLFILPLIFNWKDLRICRPEASIPIHSQVPFHLGLNDIHCRFWSTHPDPRLLNFEHATVFHYFVFQLSHLNIKWWSLSLSFKS